MSDGQWGWAKQAPNGVTGPETDPLAMITGDLDEYFIKLMEPMMKFLEKMDEQNVERPMGVWTEICSDR